MSSVGQLEHPAVINTMVEPATLPDKDTPPLQNFARCTVSGWGVTWLYGQSLSSELRSVDVDYFLDCWSYYPFRITQNMMCAGSLYGGKDSCQVSRKVARVSGKRRVRVNRLSYLTVKVAFNDLSGHVGAMNTL